MKLTSILTILICITSCTTPMNIKKLAYGSQLKKLEITDISFNMVALDELPAPYYKDYSHHESAAARNYKSYDTMGFRDTLLHQVSAILNDTVLKLMVITPKDSSPSYDVFAYLANKEIVALQFQNTGNFKQWMDVVFQKNQERLEEYKINGQFERQPELNRNPQFMLVISKEQFSQKWVNSGMLIDERPYEKTGMYLYKNAPKQYNEAKIAAEKSKYIKKYIDTNGKTNFNTEKLKEEFAKYVSKHNLKSKPPVDNEAIYKEFESLAGYPFPKELKTLFTLHNGINNTDFLDAQQVLTEWKNWKTIYDDPNWMLVDLTGNNEPDGRKTVGIYTTPYWIPFISTGGGNFIAIDYAPGSKGISGQIITFGADQDRITCIAENLQDFLEQ